MHQNTLRYQGICLCCDVADVNNTVNSSQVRWQHDLRLTRSYSSQSYPGVMRVTPAGVTLEVVGGPTQGGSPRGDGGSPNPQALEYSNVSALHDSHSHAPRDAKYVVPAKCGASLHKITVPSLNTKKTLPIYTLCSETIATRRPVSHVTHRGTIPVTTPRFHGPLRVQTNGKFNGFPKFRITCLVLPLLRHLSAIGRVKDDN